MHSLYFMGEEPQERYMENKNPVMYSATYYGYPNMQTYPMYSGYPTFTTPSYSDNGRDIYNIGGGGSSSKKSSKTLEDIKKKVDSIDKTLKSIEEAIKNKL